jgi:serine/threonine protein phosphatase PrpC
MNIEELRDGLWNKIQASDVEREVKRMPEIARAKSDSLPEEAEQTFKRLLAQKIADQNIRLEFISKAVPPN